MQTFPTSIFSIVFSTTVLLSATFTFSSAHAKTLMSGKSDGISYRVEQITDGLPVIWGMAFLTPNQLIFTQRSGEIGLYNLTTSRKIFLSGSPKVFASAQGGMLDVAIPPNYQSGDWIYFTYSKPFKNNEAATTLARAKLTKKRLTDWQDLLITQSRSSAGQHYGSRIAFDNANHLFFGIGDRGHRPNGQNLKTHAGSLLRLTLDGKVPADNPFVNQNNALPEIWSYGHRNPQGLVYDIKNKRLWEIEHGPRGGDEINLIKRGANYGWPVISHGKEYWGPVAVGEGTSKLGMEQPVKVYIPSIAPSSLLFYTGKAFPNWHGNLFAGALKLKHLNRIALNNQGNDIAEERLLGKLKERIRSLAQSPEGWIYIGTDSGKIIRIRPN